MKSILLSLLVLGVLGGIFGALLAYASKIFHVDVDPKVSEIRSCLAGANCGGCGYPGCDGYAAAVAAGKAPTNKCAAAGEEAAKKIATIMGVSSDFEKVVAFVPCSGCNAEKRFIYNGPKDCRAAMLFGGKSNKSCTFACIGYGNCVEACKFDAMHIVDGIAQVDRDKCLGCGCCVDACPKNLVKLVVEKQKTQVTCSSKDKGAKVMKICDVGCIGCMKCQRECPAEAITVTDFLASIDPEKCTNCGHCAEICPRKIISTF